MTDEQFKQLMNELREMNRHLTKIEDYEFARA